MNHPIHSVKYIRKKYKTYLIISVVFAVVTLLVALSAAITGLRIARIDNRQVQSQSNSEDESAGNNKLKTEIQVLKIKLAEYQKQLAAEKSRIKSQSAKIKTLEKKIADALRPKAADTAPAAASQTLPPGTNTDGPEVTDPSQVEKSKPNLSEPPVAPKPGASKVKESLDSTAMVDSKPSPSEKTSDEALTPKATGMENDDQPTVKTSLPKVEE